MNDRPPKRQDLNLATICAAHTQRVQHLAGQFWSGELDIWHYRKRSRELTQQLVNEVTAIIQTRGRE